MSDEVNIAPTTDDLERDLAADLALCEEKAIGTHYDLCLMWEARECDCGINAAREGWPAAIRRALAAEREVERLRGIVNDLAARVAGQSELLSRRAGRP